MSNPGAKRDAKEAGAALPLRWHLSRVLGYSGVRQPPVGREAAGSGARRRTLAHRSKASRPIRHHLTANLSGWVLEIIQPKPRATVQQSQKIR